MIMHKDYGVAKLLKSSIDSDVDQFMAFWDTMNAIDPEHYPKKLESNIWIEQFWAWMEGE